jgi:cytochrome b561
MHGRWAHRLLWFVVALVGAALLLAVTAEEVASVQLRGRVLAWHEWLGLASLPMLIAALVIHWRSRHPHRRRVPEWPPYIRQSIRLALYVLLVLQPLSGWLLASHEGTLANLLPPLVSPDSVLADIGYVYHGVGGLLIVLIAAFGIRLHATAFVAGLLRKGRVRRRHAARRSARPLK